MPAARISVDQVPLAAEDRFLIVSIQEARSMCPSPLVGRALADAIQRAKPFLGTLTPLFDLRGLPAVYGDVADFLEAVEVPGSHILLSPGSPFDRELEELVKRQGFRVLTVKGHSYKARSFASSLLVHDPDEHNDHFFDVSCGIVNEVTYRSPTVANASEPESLFAPTLDEIRSVLTRELLADTIARYFPARVNGIGSREFLRSINAFLPAISTAVQGYFADESIENAGLPELTHCFRSALLHAFLSKLHRNSLMVEFVMSTDGNEIACAPYHASALHNIEQPRSSDVLVGRPGVLARRTYALFSDEISKLTQLLNDPCTRERHLQRFLEDHLNFLRGLNYNNVYPQLVLEREDGSTLRPDFILEPYDDNWCDILDIKLPGQSVLVGKQDRQSLSAAIHQVAAQLREYAAYFDENKHRKWVREKYGLRVYRPRLIAVVGRDMREMAEAEVRRAMTCYNDVQVMTFDQLLKHAQSRLLI